MKKFFFAVMALFAVSFQSLFAAANAEFVTAVTTGTTTMTDTLTAISPLLIGVVVIGAILGAVFKFVKRAG